MSAVESWFASATVAEPLPARRPQPRRPVKKAAAKKAAARTSKRRGQGRRVRGSLVWMTLFAALLVGVVTLNVAVLRANVSVNDLDTKISQLQLKNAKLASQLSSATAAPRVQAAARQAGLVPAPAGSTALITMGSGK